MRPQLSDFVGEWRVLRVIRHVGGPVARFEGTARWTPEQDGLREVEQGTLSQSGQSFETSRQTLWQAGAEGIEVTFPDGRPFHRIVAGARTRAFHDCPPDAYWLSYDFSLWPRWSVRWDVSGPRKSYRALTRYVRVGAFS